MSPAIATTIPHGKTARRLDWVHLPPRIRRTIEAHLGSPVIEAASQTSGFTPGFASVLTCEDGTTAFVKAASSRAQRPFAEAYREEARKLRMIPATVAAPRLEWVHDADDWVVLGIRYVAGQPPSRPWTAPDLAAVSAMLVETAELLTPAPDIGLTPVAEEFADWPAYWDRFGHLPYAAEAKSLAERAIDAAGGETLCHTDVRDDNLMIDGDGKVWLCDWNWPVRGAAWLDSLWLLIGPRGDGLDVESHIESHPLLSRVEPEAIDGVLALTLGYFQMAADEPVPATSPWIREAQAWQRDVIASWLAERLGW